MYAHLPYTHIILSNSISECSFFYNHAGTRRWNARSRQYAAAAAPAFGGGSGPFVARFPSSMNKNSEAKQKDSFSIIILTFSCSILALLVYFFYFLRIFIGKNVENNIKSFSSFHLSFSRCKNPPESWLCYCMSLLFLYCTRGWSCPIQINNIQQFFCVFSRLLLLGLECFSQLLTDFPRIKTKF